MGIEKSGGWGEGTDKGAVGEGGRPRPSFRVHITHARTQPQMSTSTVPFRVIGVGRLNDNDSAVTMN